MIFLDTNVIVDLLGTEGEGASDWSRRTFAGIVTAQGAHTNHVVLAEVAAGAANPQALPADLARFDIELADLTAEVALTAGRAFAAYRRRGGPRQTILADFLIGGHAQALGASLMTRDRRLAGYFPDLPLITPETHP